MVAARVRQRPFDVGALRGKGRLDRRSGLALPYLAFAFGFVARAFSRVIIAPRLW